MTPSLPEMVLTFDFNLGRLDVALRGPAPEWVWGHRAYANNWAGYQQLKQDLLAELQRAARCISPPWASPPAPTGGKRSTSSCPSSPATYLVAVLTCTQFLKFNRARAIAPCLIFA